MKQVEYIKKIISSNFNHNKKRTLTRHINLINGCILFELCKESGCPQCGKNSCFNASAHPQGISIQFYYVKLEVGMKMSTDGKGLIINNIYTKKL